MKSFTALVLAALAVAGAQAAPTKSDMQCHKVKGPSKLTVLMAGKGNGQRNGTTISKGSDGRHLLHMQDGSDQRFEFFQCDSPPEGFKAPSKTPRGQVRSEKHPDMCLTVGGVDNRPRYIYDLGEAEQGDFDLKNGIISLEPCSKNPRKQWWDLKYDRISYIGSEKDSKREDVAVDYHKKHPVVHNYPVKNRSSAPFGGGYGTFLELR